MLKAQRSAAVRYGLAIAATVISLAVALLLRSLLPERTPHIVFFAGVAVTAGFGGLGPGILATALCVLADSYYFLGSAEAILYASASRRVDLSLFVVLGLAVSAFSETLRRAYQRAEEARADAESARRRIAFLARASELLDASLDYNTTLASVARLAVPTLADWCAIEIREDGSLRELATAHVDPDKEQLVRALERRYPLDAHGMPPIQRVITTGEPDLYQDIPEASLLAAARDADHLAALRALRIHSYLCVPLRSQAKTLGAMLFVSSARHRYSPADVSFAEDLARRAALAVENANLYRAATQEIEVRRRAEEELELRRREVEELNERLQRAMTETHHRVKNNLQIIAGMVDMRLGEGNETVSSDELRRLGAYVRTLAAVHDILTREAKEDGQTRDVSASAIFHKLMPLIQQAAESHRIEHTCEDIRLTARQGTSLALLVNELVSNGIKHGRSRVNLTFRRSGFDAVLAVADDGPGFPAGFDPVTSSNTGLELVESLSRWDLAGETAFANGPEGGALVTVRFPLPQRPGDVIRPVRAAASVQAAAPPAGAGSSVAT